MINDKDKKDLIAKKIKDSIDSLKSEWAQNWIAKEYNSKLDTVEAKKQVESAVFNMASIEKKIEWFEEQLNNLIELKVKK